MEIGLFVKNEVVPTSLVDELVKKIKSLGHSYNNENPEIVFTIGGDGTFLKAVHFYLKKLEDITFVCLNKGKLGYFSDFKVEDFEDILESFTLDKFKINEMRLVKAEFDNEEIYAVNEIRIENPFRTLTCEVYVNGDYLETFRGNGLVISTSSGSSAYNKSLGGAVIDNSLELLELNEIAPINNRLYSSLHSPLIVSGDSLITFKGDISTSVLGYDHLVKKDYKSKEISFSLSNKKVSVLSKKETSFINKINNAFISK